MSCNMLPAADWQRGGDFSRSEGVPRDLPAAQEYKSGIILLQNLFLYIPTI